MPDEIKTTIPPNPDAEFLPLPLEIGGVKLEQYTHGREDIWQNVMDTVRTSRLPDFHVTMMSWTFLFMLTLQPGKAAVASMNFERLMESALAWRERLRGFRDNETLDMEKRLSESATKIKAFLIQGKDPDKIISAEKELQEIRSALYKISENGIACELAEKIYTAAARWRVTTQDPSDPEGARSDDDNPKAPSQG